MRTDPTPLPRGGGTPKVNLGSTCAVCDGWVPAKGSVLCSAEPMVAASALVAHSDVAAVSGDHARAQYAAKRDQLFGKQPPKSYGLGGHADKLKGSAPTSIVSRPPKPLEVDAVGLVVVWQGRLVTVARNHEQRCIFHKAIVSRPPQPLPPQRTAGTTYISVRPELIALLRDHFGGYAFCEAAEELVEKAVHGKVVTDSWVVASREASGRFPSNSVCATRVRLSLYRVVLPDSLDWGRVTTRHTIAAGTTTTLHLHLPVHYNGTGEAIALHGSFSMQLVSQGGRFGVVAKPDETDARPFAIGQLGLCTPREFAAYYERFGLTRIYAKVADILPGGAPPPHAVAPALMMGGILRAAKDSAAEEYMRELVALAQESSLLYGLRVARRLGDPRGAYGRLWEGPADPLGGPLSSKMLELHCVGTVVTDVLCGLKTVESRLAWGPYPSVEPGWLLCLRNGPLGVWALVRAVHSHDSFVDAARAHGKALLPHLDVKHMSDAQIDYYFLSMYRKHADARSSQSGTSLIRNWLTTTAKTGCVICWEIKVLPARCNIQLPRRFDNLATVGERPAAAHSTRCLFRKFAILCRRRCWLRYAKNVSRQWYRLCSNALEALRLRTAPPDRPTPPAESAQQHTSWLATFTVPAPASAARRLQSTAV